LCRTSRGLHGAALATARLSRLYNTQYIDAAERGGMAAVCETDHFRDLIARIPDRRSQIMAWETAAFTQVMQRWRNNLEAGEADPMRGASEQALRSIDFPVCVIPGNDRTRSVAAGRLGV
jgi:hypothetical protein